MSDPASSRRPHDPRRTRRVLLLLAAIGIAPVVASTVAYYFFPRSAHTNYGTLLAVAPAGDVVGRTADGSAFSLSQMRGQWVLVVAAAGACDATCEGELYATRQARTIQNKNQERVARVWLVTDDVAPAPTLLAQHPGIVVAHVGPAALRALPAGDRAIYLVDPLGNLVLQYPEAPDIRKLARDLGRVLQASSIG